MLLRLSAVPLAFLGVGVYRAWIATFFRFGAYPGVSYADYAVFEASIGAASFACALLARRAAPLWGNRRVLATSWAAMTLGSVAVVCATLVPGGAGVDVGALPLVALKEFGMVAAGGGLGILIIIWCEFYGALNPMRVAVYHACAILFGECLLWLFCGLDAGHLAVFSLVLPSVSLGWAHRSIGGLPAVERPREGEVIRRSLIPWKPVACMAVCTFAMQFATMPGRPLAAGNLVGVAAACLFVVLGSLSTSRWFNFDTIYRVGFPLVCAASLVVTPLLGGHPQAAAFFFDGGYTMMSMFVMIVLANITYRFGISAAWLNGIERGIRYLVETLGWAAYLLVDGALPPLASNVVHVAVALAVFVAFLAIVLPEKSLGARWGIDLHEGVAHASGESGAAGGSQFAGKDGARAAGGVGGAGDTRDAGEAAEPFAAARDPFAPGLLSMRVSDLAARHRLTDREEEILQLMARKVPMAQMEENLFVARGTIKAHTSRIYKKLGVHSRPELYDLLGVGPDGSADVEQGR